MLIFIFSTFFLHTGKFPDAATSHLRQWFDFSQGGDLKPGQSRAMIRKELLWDIYKYLMNWVEQVKGERLEYRVLLEHSLGSLGDLLLEVVEELVGVEPNHPELLLTLAQLYVRRREYEKAKNVIKHIIESQHLDVAMQETYKNHRSEGFWVNKYLDDKSSIGEGIGTRINSVWGSDELREEAINRADLIKGLYGPHRSSNITLHTQPAIGWNLSDQPYDNGKLKLMIGTRDRLLSEGRTGISNNIEKFTLSTDKDRNYANRFSVTKAQTKEDVLKLYQRVDTHLKGIQVERPETNEEDDKINFKDEISMNQINSKEDKAIERKEIRLPQNREKSSLIEDITMASLKHPFKGWDEEKNDIIAEKFKDKDHKDKTKGCFQTEADAALVSKMMINHRNIKTPHYPFPLNKRAVGKKDIIFHNTRHSRKKLIPLPFGMSENDKLLQPSSFRLSKEECQPPIFTASAKRI